MNKFNRPERAPQQQQQYQQHGYQNGYQQAAPVYVQPQYQPPPQQPQRQFFGPKPIYFKEGEIYDFRHPDKRNVSICEPAAWTDSETLCIAVDKGFGQKLTAQQVTVVMLRGDEDYEAMYARGRELADMIDLGMDDLNWAKFSSGIRAMARKLNVMPTSMDSYMSGKKHGVVKRDLAGAFEAVDPKELEEITKGVEAEWDTMFETASKAEKPTARNLFGTCKKAGVDPSSVVLPPELPPESGIQDSGNPAEKKRGRPAASVETG